MTGYQVYAPYGSCIVHASPSRRDREAGGAEVAAGGRAPAPARACRSSRDVEHVALVLLRPARRTTRSLPSCSKSTSLAVERHRADLERLGRGRAGSGRRRGGARNVDGRRRRSSVRSSGRPRRGRGRSAARRRAGRRRRGRRESSSGVAERRVEGRVVGVRRGVGLGGQDAEPAGARRPASRSWSARPRSRHPGDMPSASPQPNAGGEPRAPRARWPRHSTLRAAAAGPACGRGGSAP